MTDTLPAARAPEPDAPAEEVTTPAADTSEEATAPERTPPALRDMPGMLWPVAIVALVGATAAALVGFALSYRTLVDAAQGWGFGVYGSRAFPIGVDGAIVGFYAFDLILVWRRMPKPMLRGAAHLMTAVTIALNVTAASSSAPGRPDVWAALAEQPGRLISHAAMPIVFVFTVEGVRHLISRTARLEAGVDAGVLTLADWALHPVITWRIFQHAKTWPCTYDRARREVRELAVYRVWLKHRQAIEAGLKEGQVSALDRLPDLLAPYGVSVEDALAVPDEMRRRERERQATRKRIDQELKHQAECEERERAHAEKLAKLAAEKEELRAAGELDVLRAEVEGERQAAAHLAAAAADTAGIEAAAARSAAERAATEAERRAAAEEEAEESARTMALRRKAAEDERAAARAAKEAAEAADRAADIAARAAAKEAEAQRIAAAAERDKEAAAAAELRAAQAREEARRAELRAVAAEDALSLSDRDRRVRRVAWMIATRAGGDPLRLPLGEIEVALGVQNGAASTYRKDAADLIGSGYDYRTDPLHAAYQEVYKTNWASA
ncbi:DUF2637 domain-containing protein [Streptomyces sp. CB03238]|uniref:DUF2637 domain-containing protein n=1 Tax=Streptomyces sp. CB03238 TaxID=1907777 RepID=UPI001F4EBFE8|nr:DUF2637 domain-containing protein [Streptomyces sp. CB03238]